MNKIIVSGIGPVAPIGTGKEQFWNNTANGISAMNRAVRSATPSELYCGEINGLDFDSYIQNRRFRRAAEISKYALVAAEIAIKDSGAMQMRNKDTALVMGVTHGALTYTQAFHTTLVKEGGGSASPLLFTDSILNAPAGNAAICFGIEGPVHTLVGGPSVSLKAFMLACLIVKDEKASNAVVVSSEELNELSSSCCSRLGVTSPVNFQSEGSGAIFIERESKAVNLSPYCYLAGYASFCCPSDRERALMRAMQMSLKMADLDIVEIDFMLTDMPISDVSIPSGSIIPLAGNAFSVTAMWHVILSSLALQKNTIPASIASNAKFPAGVRNIMICSSEEQGVASVVILSRCAV